jgi:uncharacterized repeat protein (TIGR03803 family)
MQPLRLRSGVRVVAGITRLDGKRIAHVQWRRWRFSSSRLYCWQARSSLQRVATWRLVRGGTVFELVRGTRGWKYKSLYNFECDTEVHTGAEASAGPIFDAKGNLYGTNPCNSYKDGLVYELVRHKDGSFAYKDLWDFTDGLDGGKPAGALVFDKAGNLYGTTEIGGKYDVGTVFKLAPTAQGQWKESVLHSFKGGASDGQYAWGSLIFDAAGNLYGMTANGGIGCGAAVQRGLTVAKGCGTVFKLTPTSDGKWKETLLHHFAGGKDGSGPDGGSLVMDAVGNLYGTAVSGGRGACLNGGGCGLVFEITP